MVLCSIIQVTLNAYLLWADCCVLCSFMLNKSLIPQATENMLFSLSLMLLPALMEMSDTLVFYFTLFFILYFLLLSGATYFMSCMLHPVFVLPKLNSPSPPTTQTHTIHVCWICLLCCCCLPEFSLSFPSVEWTIGIKKCPQHIIKA